MQNRIGRYAATAFLLAGLTAGLHAENESLEAKRAEWIHFRENFKYDDSDGTKLLDPPEGNRFPAPLPIIRDGKPRAAIFYDAPYCVTGIIPRAAEDLRDQLKQITGAELPINKLPRGVEKPTILLLGKTPSFGLHPPKGFFDKELQTLSGTDGYAIKSFVNDNGNPVICIFGQREKGTMNGVYSMIENNTDLIWARPNKSFGTVFSPKKDLDFVWGEGVIDRPAVSWRGWGGFEGVAWQARNKANFIAGAGGDNYWSFANTKNWGSEFFMYRGGHNIGEFIRETHSWDKNPEFASFIDGKRVLKNGYNFCMTNPEARKVFIANVMKAARRAPGDIAGIQISLDDSWSWCECENCMKPITVDGVTVKQSDPNFISTMVFMLLNETAETLGKEFPGYRLKTNGYFQTAEVPACKIHPSVVVAFAPYPVVNDKDPLFMPRNVSWYERLKQWGAKLPKHQLLLRGYDGLGQQFPQPLAHARKRNYLEFSKYLDSLGGENMIVWGDEENARSPRYGSSMRVFDYSAIEHWVTQRLFWNPDQDVERLYKYFCYRTYREAAVPMEKFFGTIRETFIRGTTDSNIIHDGLFCTQEYVLRPGLENKLRGYLAEAADIVKHPASKAQIERVRERFEFFVERAKQWNTPSVAAPLIRVNGMPSFEDPCWEKASVVTEFAQCGKPSEPAKNKVEFAVFHDYKNLYLRIRSNQIDINNLYIDYWKQPGSREGAHPRATTSEIFLADAETPSVYYLFMLNPEGKQADFQGTDIKWDGAFETKARKCADRWEGIWRIPFTDLHLDITKNNVLRGTFINQVFRPSAGHPGMFEVDEYTGWGGGAHHRPATWGTITLMR